MEVFRVDEGFKYIDNEMKTFLNENGIQFQITYSPQQNVISKRKNHTIMDVVRSMLNSANLPKFLWAEALSNADYTQNQ